MCSEHMSHKSLVKRDDFVIWCNLNGTYGGKDESRLSFVSLAFSLEELSSSSYMLMTHVKSFYFE